MIVGFEAIHVKELLKLCQIHLKLTADDVSEKCRWHSNRNSHKTFLYVESKPFNELISSERSLIEGLIYLGILKKDHYLLLFDQDTMSELAMTELFRESEKMGFYE